MKLKLTAFVLVLVIGAGAAAGWYHYDNRIPEINYDVVRIGVDVPYPPYEFRDSNGELTGFEIDLGNATCEHLEIRCEWVVTPWDGIIDGLLDGKYDAIMSSMGITAERAEKVDFGDAYYSIPSVFFGRKEDNIGSASVSAMSNLRVGVIANTLQEERVIEDYGDAVRLRSYATVDEVNQAMEAREVDVVLHDYPHWEEGFMLDGGYEVLGKPITMGSGVGMAFRQGDDDLRRLFNQGLKAMKRDGTYTMMRKKYIFFKIMAE